MAELLAAVAQVPAVHAGLHGGGGIHHDLRGRYGLQEFLLPRVVAVSEKHGQAGQSRLQRLD